MSVAGVKEYGMERLMIVGLYGSAPGLRSDQGTSAAAFAAGTAMGPGTNEAGLVSGIAAGPTTILFDYNAWMYPSGQYNGVPYTGTASIALQLVDFSNPTRTGPRRSDRLSRCPSQDRWECSALSWLDV